MERNGSTTTLDSRNLRKSQKKRPKRVQERLLKKQMTKRYTKWVETVHRIQKYYYLSFHGTQFHDLTGFDEELRITKILFAMFGCSSKAYSKEQRDMAKEIYLRISEEVKQSQKKKFELAVVFVCYLSKEEKTFHQRTFPVFSIPWNDSVFNRRFIDTNCEVYANWESWQTNIRHLLCCYPKYGFYSCDDNGSFQFDPNEGPVLKFNYLKTMSWPNLSNDLLHYFGFNSSPLSNHFFDGQLLMGLCCSTIFPTLNESSLLLNDGRLSRNLVRINAMLSTLTSPEHYFKALFDITTKDQNYQVVYTKMQRLLAAVLLAIDLSKGFPDKYSLIEAFFFLISILSMFDQKNLSNLNLYHFSMRTYFFTNTFVSSKDAREIIFKFDKLNLKLLASKMSDVKTKMIFEKFLARNPQKRDDRRVVRAVNFIDNPVEFFSTISELQYSVTLDRLNKLDRVVILTDPESFSQTLDLKNKKVKFTTKSQFSAKHKFLQPTRLKKALGRHVQQHRYLSMANSQEKGRINNVIGAAANFCRDTVKVAEKLADEIGAELKKQTTPGEFLSLIEIIVAEKKKATYDFEDNSIFQLFKMAILRDLVIIDGVEQTLELNSLKLKFADKFLALYHYRKHGDEFMEGCPLTYYLGELPQALLKKGKLSEICRVTTIKEDNTQEIFYRQTYILQNDSMLVTTQSISNSSARISTIHKNRGVSAKYQNRIDEFACGDLASDTKELLDKMITLRISFEREDFVDAQAQAAENIIDLVE